MRRFAFILAFAFSTKVAGLCLAGTQINPTDLPPSPFSLPASTEPQSASYSRDAAAALKIHAASTNAAVQKTLGEIRAMKEQLAAQEKTARQKDPLLLTCDQFIEKTHDWVMEKHHAEMETESAFFFSTNPAEAGERRKLESDLTRMMELLMFHELGGNTNFAPLQKSLYAIVEQFSRQDTNASSRQDICRYWWFDRFIGFPDTNRPAADCSFTNLQTQIGRRYDLLVAGLTKIQRDKNIPPEAIAGLKYGHLYRTLDGMCEVYLEARTPPELQKLRENLHRKIIDLSWLERQPPNAH
jgi:hypothetical protein